ncbi:MAG: alpha/beta fold hydrolase [Bacteroidota bacterium]
MKYIVLSWALLCLCFSSCEEEELIGTQVAHHFFLENDHANMPVLVEGNTASKIFLLILHGGPGGDAMIYNHALSNFSDPLEERYAVVYWDQRASGNASGKFGNELMTIEQFVDDLNQLINLLEFRYGNDIQHFLLGHSWGGALGTAYLTTKDYQNRIAGWMNVAGVHNFIDYATMTRECLINKASEQINSENYGEKWQEILDFCTALNPDDISNLEETRLNQFGHKAGEYLTEDDVVQESMVNAQSIFKYSYFSNHNTLTATTNLIFTSLELFNKTEEDYTSSLSKVQTPASYIWGRHDCVVPLAMGQQAFEAHGSADKELVILERSAHSPMINEPEAFVNVVVDFIEEYR